MKPITYRRYQADGTIGENIGYPTETPGLYVSPCLAYPDHWVVAHARGGGILRYRFASPEAALALANRLADAADWTLPAEELMGDRALFNIVAETAIALGGVFPAGRGGLYRPLDNGVPA